MRFVGSITQLICLGAFLQSLVKLVMTNCSNGAGYCDFYSYYLRCYIENNDTQLIKALLKDCSENSSARSHLNVNKNYVSTEYGNLLIDFDLPTNIQNLRIYNDQDQDHIRVTTFVQNYGLEEISCDEYLELETNTFFTNFTNIRYIYLRNLLSREAPSFSNLQYLKDLNAKILSPVTYAFDDTIVSGSTNLVYLYLYESSFNGITKGAFQGLYQLTRLDISGNKLTFIEEGSFTDLTSIGTIYLYNNKLTSVPDNVFEGLTKLTRIYLYNNPGFPINALMSARYVEDLELQNNGYETLDPFVFQQMDSLRDLYLDDPFICDCRLQWISSLNQYGIYVSGGPSCSEPFDFAQRDITNQQIYTNCPQTQTYQCFNSSNTCPSDLLCHNTEDDYVCACPIGHVLHTSGECKDIDECDEVTECQHDCVNTDGSFHCACQEGYELASNEYDCDDVNECQTESGGCQFGCSNTVGSYQCYCANGHKLKNETHCELNENSSIDGQELEFYQISLPLLGVLLVIIVLLIIVIIALCIYTLRKSAVEKKQRKNQGHNKPQNDEDIYFHNYIYERRQEGSSSIVAPQSNSTSENQVKLGTIQEDPTYHMD